MAIVKKKSGGVVRKSGSTSSSSGSFTKSEFKLPTEKSVAATELGQFSLLIFGDKKVGKTELSAQFPDSFHAMWEPGGKVLEVYQSSFDSWNDFKKAIRLLRTDKQFTTVVIDTVDLAFKAAQDAACAKLGIDDPADEDWGKGWRMVKREFEATIQSLLAHKGVVFISHGSTLRIKKRDGTEYDTFMSTMPKQARDVIEGVVDIWACFTYDGEDRVLVIEGGEDISAGHRLRYNFRYTDGTPMRQIPMGTSPEEAYQNLNDAFNNLLPPPKKSVKSETKKPVTLKKRKVRE